MIWRNTVERYGAVAKFLHWTIAILILGMLVMGWRMVQIPDPAAKFWVFSIHKATGITILALVILRVIWRLVNWDLPRPLPTHQRWEQKLAWWTHWLLYGLIIVQPLSGWILTGAANSTINWYGFFPIPNIVHASPALKYSMAMLHNNLPFVMLAIIGLHVAGALKHVVIDKDGTLRRMLPFTAPVLFALLLPFAAYGKDDVPPSWTIDRANSTLTFEATQEGSPFKGQFKAFDGTVMLDPDHPETGKAAITIDLGSIDTQNAERDSTVKGTDWFDLGSAPTAAYTVSKFEKSGDKDGQLLAVGVLRLRSIEKPLDMPFTLTMDEKDGVKTAHAVGDATLKRLDFGVGAGQWADPAMVGDAVLIHVNVTLVPAKPE